MSYILIKNLSYFFTSLPLIVILFVLLNFPAEIPVHWNSEGIVTQYGSKYYVLILPLVLLIAGLCFFMAFLFNDYSIEIKKNLVTVYLETSILINILIALAMILVFKELDGHLGLVLFNKIFLWMLSTIAVYMILLGFSIAKIPLNLMSIPKFLMPIPEKEMLMPKLFGYSISLPSAVFLVSLWFFPVSIPVLATIWFLAIILLPIASFAYCIF